MQVAEQQCNDYATSWTVWGSKPGNGKRFSSAKILQHPDSAVDTASHLMGTGIVFRRQGDWDVKLNTHFHLVPRLRMGGGKTPLCLCAAMEPKEKTTILGAFAKLPCHSVYLQGTSRFPLYGFH